jgi:hypothetical protein
MFKSAGVYTADLAQVLGRILGRRDGIRRFLPLRVTLLLPSTQRALLGMVRSLPIVSTANGVAVSHSALSNTSGH